MRIKNTSNNLEPFAEPGDPRRVKKVGEIVKTLKFSLKTEYPPGPGEIYRGSPGF